MIFNNKNKDDMKHHPTPIAPDPAWPCRDVAQKAKFGYS
jgi:hypothetical protein